MIQDIDEINVNLSDPGSIDISIDNDNSISVSEAAPTDIAQIMHNEEIRQENEAQRIANEEQRIANEEAREDYITDLKQRVLDGEFNGEDGYSPSASVSKVDSTATITITDKNGTTTAQISDGTDGRDGVDGQDGTDGVDGYSPTVTMTKQGKVTTLTITDKDGAHTTEIKDGQDGSGTGDMLKATYDTNDNGIVDNAEKVNNHTVLTDVPANAVFTDTTYTAGTGIDITNNVISNTQTSAEWGSITGTLSDQTDLNSALSGKQDLIDSTHKLSADLVDDTSTTNKFFSGNYNDLTNKPTIPTNTSDLTNDSNFISTSSTAGLIKNDGTIDTTSYSTFSGSYTDLSNKPTIPDELADLSDDSTHRVVTDTEKTTWNGKQNAITSSHKLSADLINDSSTTNKFVTLTQKAFWNDKQEPLVSGTNIKTINNTSILGSGNLDVGADIPQQDSAPSNPQEDDLWIDTDEPGASITVDSTVSTSSTNPVENQAITNYVDDEVATKQDILTTTVGTINVSLANTNVEKNQYIKYGKIVSVQLVFTTQNQIGQWSFMEIANGLPIIDTNYSNNRFEFYGFGDGYEIRSAITELGQIVIFYNYQQIPAGNQLKFYTTYISKD